MCACCDDVCIFAIAWESIWTLGHGQVTAMDSETAMHATCGGHQCRRPQPPCAVRVQSPCALSFPVWAAVALRPSIKLRPGLNRNQPKHVRTM